MLQGKCVKVRWVKSYATAHNHIAIGDVLHETAQYLMLRCKTYHFGENIGGKKAPLCPGKYVAGVLEGEKCIRVIPWNRIEVIHALPAGTDWDVKAYVDDAGLCWLANERKTVVTRAPTRGE